LFGIRVHAIKPLVIYLLARLPRFFTPNEDSINDLWTIKNLDLFPQATITIFNRYGKITEEMVQQVWVGMAPLTDQTTGRTIGLILTLKRNHKGHFSLKE
jgi:gliding motility-associated-like protein